MFVVSLLNLWSSSKNNEFHVFQNISTQERIEFCINWKVGRFVNLGQFETSKVLWDYKPPTELTFRKCWHDAWSPGIAWCHENMGQWVHPDNKLQNKVFPSWQQVHWNLNDGCQSWDELLERGGMRRKVWREDAEFSGTSPSQAHAIMQGDGQNSSVLCCLGLVSHCRTF